MLFASRMARCPSGIPAAHLAADYCLFARYTALNGSSPYPSHVGAFATSRVCLPSGGDMRDAEMEPADFRKQPVWRQAFRLTIDVYRLMGAFPSLERWDGLATLMRKSVSSMGAHIAEGCTHLGCPEGA